jgi:hypothetical protein
MIGAISQANSTWEIYSMDKEDGMKLLGCFGLIALLVLNVILTGWVLSILWAWFIVPVFSAPALSIPYALGVALVVGMMTHQPNRAKDERKWYEIIAHELGDPIVILVMGYIIRLFV